LGEGIDMSNCFCSFDLKIKLSMRGKIISFLLREYVSEVMIFWRQAGSVWLTG
jgi:hypothetical protein